MTAVKTGDRVTASHLTNIIDGTEKHIKPKTLEGDVDGV